MNGLFPNSPFNLSPDSKRLFLEGMLNLLWRQWSALGVSGAVYSTDRPIIDPEALLLFSTVFARYDARLFDEMLDWLLSHGNLLNMQRLGNVRKKYPRFGDDRVLAACAELLGEKAILKKWQSVQELVEQYIGRLQVEPLFKLKTGESAPHFGGVDYRFQKYGLSRSQYVRSAKSLRPLDNLPACLLVKLRALFGVNARAEVMNYLLTHDEAHPAAIAKETYFFKKTIQDCLNEMEVSGQIRSRMPGREKQFLLTKGWNFLYAQPHSDLVPQWIDWPALFNLLIQVWKLAGDDKWNHVDPLLLVVEQKKLTESVSPALLKQIGIDGSDTVVGLNFLSNLANGIGNKLYAGLLLG
jgi:hypothetical protein